MYKSQKGMQVKQHCYAVSDATSTQMKIDVRNKTAAPKDFAFIWFIWSDHLVSGVFGPSKKVCGGPSGLFLERQSQVFLALAFVLTSS